MIRNRLIILFGMASYWLDLAKGNAPMIKHEYYVRKPNQVWMATTEMFYYAFIHAMDQFPARFEGWKVCRMVAGEVVNA